MEAEAEAEADRWEVLEVDLPDDLEREGLEGQERSNSVKTNREMLTNLSVFILKTKKEMGKKN